MFQYMQAHPVVSAILGGCAALALIGLWYVVSHHLRAIVTAVICVAGAAAGLVVIWRGVGNDQMDLIGIGVFLIVIFPIFMMQTLKGNRKPVVIGIPGLPHATASGAAQPKRPG